MGLHRQDRQDGLAALELTTRPGGTVGRPGPPNVNKADLAPVFFFLPRQPHLVELEALDPERDWRQFVVGERAWILQTFLRLRQAGYPVRLTAEVPRRGLLVFYANHGDLLVRSCWGGAGLCPSEYAAIIDG